MRLIELKRDEPNGALVRERKTSDSEFLESAERSVSFKHIYTFEMK